MDLGSGVIFAKVRDESEALQALRMRNRQDRPQVFSSLNISYVRRLENRLFGKDQIVYQQFIPPELTEEGYSRIIRGHFLFTPLRDMFLSAHFVVSDLELASELPFGLIRNSHGLIVNRNVGAHYERTDTQTERDLRAVAFELGHALREEISRRFEVTPDGTA
jgi:hypothetical protein